MILVAAVLFTIALCIGIWLSVKNNGKAVALFAAVLSVASFVGILWWVSSPVSSNYRRDMAHFDFSNTTLPLEKPDAYTLILARGEISSVREKWSFVNLGRLVTFTTETEVVGVEPSKFEVQRSKKYFRGISETFSLPGLPATLSIGWDDRGSEFVNVVPYRAKGRYIRPFSSYFGVFPAQNESFAATRLLISGAIESAEGSVFGLARGKMAFLIVQPETRDAKISLTAETLFTELSCTTNPYSNSNNLTSFDDARKLLLRGMVFPRHALGVLPVLESLSPVVGAMLFMLALGILILWFRWLFPAMILAVFLAMFTMLAVSKLELQSTLQLAQKGGDSGVFAMASLFSSPLWDKTTNAKLVELATNDKTDSGKWAAFLLSIRFPGPAAANIADNDEIPENIEAPGIPDESGDNPEDEGNGAELETENLPLP